LPPELAQYAQGLMAIVGLEREFCLLATCSFIIKIESRSTRGRGFARGQAISAGSSLRLLSGEVSTFE
jgi:hypothetical protein